MKTIGFIGAGHIGSQLARLAIASGYDVVVSNSRGPETLADARRGARTARARGDGRRGRAAPATSSWSPSRSRTTARSRSSRWPARSSSTPTTTTPSATGTSPSSTTSRPPRPSSCRRTCRRRRSSRPSTTSTRPSSRRTGSRPARRTAARWSSRGTTPRPRPRSAALLDQFGFDTVDAGPLAEGWRIQRDTPGYGPRRTATELRRDLAAAKRYADRYSHGRAKLELTIAARGSNRAKTPVRTKRRGNLPTGGRGAPGRARLFLVHDHGVPFAKRAGHQLGMVEVLEADGHAHRARPPVVEHEDASNVRVDQGRGQDPRREIAERGLGNAKHAIPARHLDCDPRGRPEHELVVVVVGLDEDRAARGALAHPGTGRTSETVPAETQSGSSGRTGSRPPPPRPAARRPRSRLPGPVGATGRGSS